MILFMWEIDVNRIQPFARFNGVWAFALAVLILVAGSAGQARAGSWFKVAGGVSGMAMDDINNADFRFYEPSENGYDFPPLDSGFSLSFHLGYDLSPAFALGFSWDRQYARVTGTDVDVTADLNLDANFFMTHGYWTPLRTGRFEIGAALGMGLVFTDGKVKTTGQNNVNYGEGETSGSSSLAFEIMALVNYAFKESTSLEVTFGWRDAVIKEFKYETAPAVKEDGTNLELDYTGYILKAGIKFNFG